MKVKRQQKNQNHSGTNYSENKPDMPAGNKCGA